MNAQQLEAIKERRRDALGKMHDAVDEDEILESGVAIQASLDDIPKLFREIEILKAALLDRALTNVDAEPSPHVPTGNELVDRLRGIYTVPVNAADVPIIGSTKFERRFGVGKLNLRAADEIERLQSELNIIRGALGTAGADATAMVCKLGEVYAELEALKLAANELPRSGGLLPPEAQRLWEACTRLIDKAECRHLLRYLEKLEGKIGKVRWLAEHGAVGEGPATEGYRVAMQAVIAELNS